MRQAKADHPDTQDSPRLEIEATSGGAVFTLHGNWTITHLAKADQQISNLLSEPVRPVHIDLGHLTALDTSGAWVIVRLLRALDLSLDHTIGIQSNHRTLFDAVNSTNHTAPKEQSPAPTFRALLEHVGKSVVEVVHDIALLAHLMGGLIQGLFQALADIRKLRVTSIVHHIDQAGLQAIPIVSLMSFLIGAIVAQQGAFQLRKFGAEPFVIDLVGILVLREVGILLTAILVAGRSGSAFTAELGSMKMREEIDALKVMGLNVTQVLVTPRVLALVIALPLLGLISNLAALTGGGMLLWVYSDIAPAAYIAWLREAVALNTFFVGLIKAPFMALIIALISCSEGLQVGGSAESLGSRTTAAVVKSIFLVVLVDGIFAIFFAAIGF